MGPNILLIPARCMNHMQLSLMCLDLVLSLLDTKRAQKYVALFLSQQLLLLPVLNE
jgi:hypothetical protein